MQFGTTMRNVFWQHRSAWWLLSLFAYISPDSIFETRDGALMKAAVPKNVPLHYSGRLIFIKKRKTLGYLLYMSIKYPLHAREHPVYIGVQN